MASRDDIVIEITPQVLLKAYTCGIFPMAESAEDPALYWIEPQHRGILPLDRVHVPRRLARTLRAAPYAVKIDTDIEGVIEGCAASRPGRRSTWINERIRGLYRDLFASAIATPSKSGTGSVSSAGSTAWRSTAPSSARACSPTSATLRRSRSSILPRAWRYGGFRLLDTQFVTDHLRQFGTVELNREEFHRLLEKALDVEADFHALPLDASPDLILAILEDAHARR